jgi:hypothetical protein
VVAIFFAVLRLHPLQKSAGLFVLRELKSGAYVHIQNFAEMGAAI